MSTLNWTVLLPRRLHALDDPRLLAVPGAGIDEGFERGGAVFLVLDVVDIAGHAPGGQIAHAYTLPCLSDLGVVRGFAVGGLELVVAAVVVEVGAFHVLMLQRQAEIAVDGLGHELGVDAGAVSAVFRLADAAFEVVHVVVPDAEVDQLAHVLRSAQVQHVLRAGFECVEAVVAELGEVAQERAQFFRGLSVEVQLAVGCRSGSGDSEKRAECEQLEILFHGCPP